MSQARRKAPHSTSVIEKWVNEYAREEGMVVSRLQAFAALAAEHGFGTTDVDEAASQVREMIARIDTAREAA